MKLQRVAAITLVALIATAGVAVAAPGNAPFDPGADDSERGPSGDARDDESESASAAGSDAAPADEREPDGVLPEQVPDHVGRIHDLIRQFLRGELDGSLGEAVSGVAASDDAAAENASGAIA